MAQVRGMSDDKRTFRVLRGQSRIPRAERDAWPESLPWSLVEPWRAQAEQNHGQTLERLNERGGLAPVELWCAAHGLRLRHIRDTTESAAGQWLVGLVSDHDLDIGGDVAIRLDDDGGGLAWRHPACRAWMTLRYKPDPKSTGHVLVTPWPNVTIEGSLLCPAGMRQARLHPQRAMGGRMSARRTRLVDCNPRWAVRDGVTCGVGFDCPEGHEGCAHTIPFTPALDGSPAASWYSSGAVWQRTGDTFETLSLSPSILRNPVYASREAAIAAGADEKYLEPTHFCALHIFIKDGSIEFFGDSR